MYDMSMGQTLIGGNAVHQRTLEDSKNNLIVMYRTNNYGPDHYVV